MNCCKFIAGNECLADELPECKKGPTMNAINIDREAVKTLAIAVGVRKAARQLGLKEDTVCKWSERGKWFKPPPLPPQQAVSTVSKSPSNALADTLREHSEQTKLGMATAARTAAKHAANMTPVQVLNVSRDLKNVTDIAEKVHGWNQQGGRSTNVFVNQAVVIDDATIDELQARLRRLRGEE
jgi:hypothetical protein